MNKITFSKTTIGFTIIILLVTMTGILYVITLQSISGEIDGLYKHPYTVSNAAQKINYHLVAMHRSMKDVALANNHKQINQASAIVEKHEKKAIENFWLIFDRYLGDRDKIKRVHDDFLGWREIRSEVIDLKKSGQHELSAEITRGKGADYVNNLTIQTNKLVEFSASKASEFRANAINTTRDSIYLMSSLAILVCVITLFIAFYILRGQKLYEKEIKMRAHLIDQNIMISRLKPDGEIIDISNAFCRYLESLRSDMVNTPSHFFLHGDEKNELEGYIWKVLKTGATWKGEITRTTREGSKNWGEMTVVPVFNSDYDISGYTCIMQDTTSKKMSLTDKLTTLGNRRKYEHIIHHEVAMAKRHDTRLTLAIIDVDCFKNFNDKNGHPAGDKALSDICQTILSKLRRPNDYAFRIGGEEFALIFSELDRIESNNLLEKIRKSIESLKIPHASNTASEYITISIGAVNADGRSILDAEQLYSEADKALYIAKNNRNCTVTKEL
ncbi:MAG: diguanylate cyclase [Candidatus Thiodiazotropha sp.]